MCKRPQWRMKYSKKLQEWWGYNSVLEQNSLPQEAPEINTATGTALMEPTEVQLVHVRAPTGATARNAFHQQSPSILNLQLEDDAVVSRMDNCVDSRTSVLKSLARGARRKASCTHLPVIKKLKNYSWTQPEVAQLAALSLSKSSKRKKTRRSMTSCPAGRRENNRLVLKSSNPLNQNNLRCISQNYPSTLKLSGLRWLMRNKRRKGYRRESQSKAQNLRLYQLTKP